MNNGNIVLVKPEEKYLLSYLTVCKESFHSVHNTYLLHDPDKFEEWRKTIFHRYAMNEAGECLPENYLPSVTFWALYGQRVAGVVNIRKGLNEALTDYGGNAGFMLSTSFRGKKLSIPLIARTLEKAGQLGITPVLMTCIDENIPSLSALKKFPAFKVEKAETIADGKYCAIHRFWF